MAACQNCFEDVVVFGPGGMIPSIPFESFLGGAHTLAHSHQPHIEYYTNIGVLFSQNPPCDYFQNRNSFAMEP